MKGTKTHPTQNILKGEGNKIKQGNLLIPTCMSHDVAWKVTETKKMSQA